MIFNIQSEAFASDRNYINWLNGLKKGDRVFHQAFNKRKRRLDLGLQGECWAFSIVEIAEVKDNEMSAEGRIYKSSTNIHYYKNGILTWANSFDYCDRSLFHERLVPIDRDILPSSLNIETFNVFTNSIEAFNSTPFYEPMWWNARRELLFQSYEDELKTNSFYKMLKSQFLAYRYEVNQGYVIVGFSQEQSIKEWLEQEGIDCFKYLYSE